MAEVGSQGPPEGGNAPRAIPRERRTLARLALLVAVVLVPVATVVALRRAEDERATMTRTVTSAASREARALDAYFERARAILLLTSQNSAFRAYHRPHGGRPERRRHGATVVEIERALTYLEHLYPESIGEACFIEQRGNEVARAVRGDVAAGHELSADESAAPFFRAAFATPVGRVHHAQPYISPDTGEWVVANTTRVRASGRPTRSIIHFEVTIDSFRQALDEAAEGESVALKVVDARSGLVVVDRAVPQRRPGVPVGEERPRVPLGTTERVSGLTGRSGSLDVDGRPAAYLGVERTPDNANDWLVVAVSATAPAVWWRNPGAVALGILTMAFGLFAFALSNLRMARRELQRAAFHDGLTGLGNRSKFHRDLERRVGAGPAAPLVLVLCDLNGFKLYNDTYGHLAGDALLARMGHALAVSIPPGAEAYRLGGDEFCVVASAGRGDADMLELTVLAALSEKGAGFEITASYGVVQIPDEAPTVEGALELADERMYAQKQRRAGSPSEQSRDVLLGALSEHHPVLVKSLERVAQTAVEVGAQLGLDGQELDELSEAASLHDIGKIALPQAIVEKAGALTDEERAFVRRHPLIGERILACAPALVAAARIVRSSHEHFDGSGHPDGLAGDEIPLGSRIIAVCDAFHAMQQPRPDRPGRTAEEALAEIKSYEGGIFDPAVVAALAAVRGEGGGTVSPSGTTRTRVPRRGAASGPRPADPRPARGSP